MIYIRMQAYNAERTLERAIKSIQSQTEKEWKFYLLDNGSEDGTREIVSAYAKNEVRIVPFYGDKNYDYSVNEEFWLLPHRLKEEDYLCFLDADDSYDPTFLEELLLFQKENKLDIAICGSRMVDSVKGYVCGERVLGKNYVLKGPRDYDCFFPYVHWNLRQVWGKLYTAKAAAARYDVNVPEWFPKAYGGDTINVYECVKASERIGILGKALHTYTISRGSVSYQWRFGREAADFTLFEKAKELLLQKCGHVSPGNLNFLYAVQFNALKDTLGVLFHSNLSAERKIEIVKDIFQNPITKQTFLEEGNVTQEEKTKLLIEMVCGIIELAKDAENALLRNMEDVFLVLNTDFSELIPEECLKWYLKKYPVIVRNVALGEYEYAVNNLLVYLAKEKEEKLAVDYPIILGQVLASLRGEEAKYVYFSKQLIQWCIQNEQLERAKKELEEWIAILPEDKDLKKLQEMYYECIGSEVC